MKNKLKNHKLNVSIAGWLLLIFLAALVLVRACTGSHQSSMSILLPAAFQGEYRLGEGNWETYTENTELSALKGDLYIKGNFAYEIPENLILNFYLDHIAMSMSVNGEQVFITSTMDIPEAMADSCGVSWNGWVSTGIMPEDEVEIHLHNPHRFGNKRAYDDFLKAIYVCNQDQLKDLIGTYSRPYWLAGLFILVVSALLLGMALGFRILHIPQDSLLLHLGMLSIFVGGYILLDTPDISLRNHLIVFNTCGRQLCIMLAGVELGICILKNLKDKMRKPGNIAAAAMVISDVFLLLPVLSKKVLIYDTIPAWVGIHILIVLVLAGICIYELRKGNTAHRMIMVSFLLMLAVVLLEFMNFFTYWWDSGLVAKSVFFLLIIFNLVKAVIVVSENYKCSIQSRKLEEELKNSRIVLAMSQIRTHFIFNVLNAISGFCKYDPDKADETVVRFSRYLRVNIDVLQEDKPVPFWKILEHLKDYMELEQLRFEERVHFVEKIEAEDFELPYLTIQPLLENSIKHGILPKAEGGTIELHTKREGNNILISVTDDGIGYNIEEIGKEHSVGLENVRFRLQYMMHGNLIIASEPGKGTKATILIPDNRQRSDRKCM